MMKLLVYRTKLWIGDMGVDLGRRDTTAPEHYWCVVSLSNFFDKHTYHWFSLVHRYYA